jgi:putative molybdopterin biosynthesis protein
VAAGRVDAGMGILAAARAFGLDFVPVAREPYDLVLRSESVDEELLAPLWKLLRDPNFHATVEALGGYWCAETGRRIR